MATLQIMIKMARSSSVLSHWNLSARRFLDGISIYATKICLDHNYYLTSFYPLTHMRSLMGGFSRTSVACSTTLCSVITRSSMAVEGSAQCAHHPAPMSGGSCSPAAHCTIHTLSILEKCKLHKYMHCMLCRAAKDYVHPHGDQLYQ